MKKLKTSIPNALTLMNLFSGTIAVVLALSGHMIHACWFIFLAAVFDFLDGFTARLLKAKSEIGAQLDSLADVVSFGVAPAVFIYILLEESPDQFPVYTGEFALLPFLALLLAVASAYRLAVFNLDPGQSDRFRGLPTPAMGLLVAALPLAIRQYQDNPSATGFITNQITLIVLIIVLSFLMVSRIPMISLKFSNYKWKKNVYRYVLLILSVFLLVAFQYAGLVMSILLYIFISLIEDALTWKIKI
jgi:CDP-diacylglycerol---serine O-phosphatidyltransferase